MQRRISPIATRLFSVAFLGRHQIASGIRALAGSFKDERANIHLRLALISQGIILQDYRAVPLDKIEHYHLSKTVTARDLSRAAISFREQSGRQEFMSLVSGIITGQNIEIKPGEVDYKQIFSSAVKSRIDKLLDEKSLNATVLEKAFELASRQGPTNRDTLIYRMQKMSDIGGNVQAIIAALFMDRPAEAAHELFRQSNGEFLGERSEPVYARIREYQDLLGGFSFDGLEMMKDENYLAKKMAELVKRSQNPQALLLFFLHKLNEARQAQDFTAPIFGEIRYLYAPLAERMSLVFLADDFRDQFLRLSQPEKYAAINQKVFARIKMSYADAKIFLSLYTRKLFGYLQKELAADSQELIMKFRVKSPYSLWNKVEVRREYSFDGLKDILGIKIICETNEAMEAVMRCLVKNNRIFRFKEGGPKKGEWRGIKLVGEHESLPIEIQIVTQAMNQENNWGKAASWIYNLEKDLQARNIKQVFRFKEPPEAITSSYVENYILIRDFCEPYLAGIS